MLVIGLVVLVFCLIAGRLRGSPLTLPLVFTAAGVALGPESLGLLDVDVGDETVSLFAEATLALVLFTDASRLDLRTVLREHAVGQRLLGLGLPLSIAIGALVGVVLLPDLPLVAVALLAAILAPTDAALGQAFVEDEHVPARVRQTLNVESGLNDGLAVPFVTVLVDLARKDAGSVLGYVGLFVLLVGVGTVVGVVVGWGGGQALARATERDWATTTTRRLAVVALAAVAFAGAEAVGGNGFVAAFVAGLVVGSTDARRTLSETSAFAQAEGQLLTLLTFLLFGAVVAGDLVLDAGWRVIAYAVLSLVLVRPAAVALSLIGSGLRASTVAFVGWAGPRGLASIVYAVLVARSAGVPEAELVFAVAGWTILLSIVLHGMSAAPLSRAYGRRIGPSGRIEHLPVSDLPVRLPRSRR